MLDGEERKIFDDVIEQFEESYHQTLARDGMTDIPKNRVEFYNACLVLLINGPRMKYTKVQVLLVEYYTDRRDEKLSELGGLN